MNVDGDDGLAAKHALAARDNRPTRNIERHAPSMGEDCETSSLSAMTSLNTKKASPVSVESISHEVRVDSPIATDGSPGEIRAMEEGSSDIPDNSAQYPSGLSMVFITVSLMMGVFMISLDTTIICK